MQQGRGGLERGTATAELRVPAARSSPGGGVAGQGSWAARVVRRDVVELVRLGGIWLEWEREWWARVGAGPG